MELPQQRPFGAEGRKPTHDFLSLHSRPTVQPDLKPHSQGGGNLKTQDFLQPLERGEAAAKEEATFDISAAEKLPPPAAPPPLPVLVEHILPGGIGTYSISHISSFNQKVVKTEGGGSIFVAGQGSSADRNDENSNCGSYTGSGFTLWEESTIKKGKTGKENVGETSNFVRDAKAAEWTSSEMPCLSSSNKHRSSFSSLSSSYQPKRQSFMDMIKSAKGRTLEDDLDDEEEFVLKRESPSPIGELRVKVDRKGLDQKANTPRSKHSATEQRRRSKINDRFQTLREIIPHSDQKRDKASFLLEVIEYIQFLQVKVQKYEGSCQGWTNDPPKLAPWRNSSGPAESFIDPSRGMNGDENSPVLFAAKFEEKNIGHSAAVGITQSLVESDLKSAAIFKPVDQHSTVVKKPIPFPVLLQPNFFNSAGTSGAVTQQPPRLAPDAEHTAQPRTQSCHTKSSTSNGDVATDKQKSQELTVEGGTISISNVYSQGLLNTLTQALKNSGVDLALASISVQIDLGKRVPSRQVASTPTLKDTLVPFVNQGTTRPRVSSRIESDQAFKKLRTSKSGCTFSFLGVCWVAQNTQKPDMLFIISRALYLTRGFCHNFEKLLSFEASNHNKVAIPDILYIGCSCWCKCPRDNHCKGICARSYSVILYY